MSRSSSQPAVFSAKSTADEVLAGVSLSGSRAIVTGGAAGVGLETARALARAGATVTLAVRNLTAAQDAIEDIQRSAPGARVEAIKLDLSDLRSVHGFVSKWRGPLHILVNNAGVMAVPEKELTPQGLELQYGTNFVGHFALAQGLHGALRDAGGAQLVSLSSSGHHFSPVIFDDLNFDFVPYSPFGAYGQSKSACALLAVAVAERWRDDGVSAHSVNPGAIATGLQKFTGGLKTPVELRKTPEQGAATSVFLAASMAPAESAGRYFENCKESHVVPVRPTDFSGGVAPYALSAENAQRLWETTTDWLARM